jgi:hypothetical protein
LRPSRSRASRDNIHTLDDYELASRLSYFLWSSMPDDELFKLAAAGKLRANLTGAGSAHVEGPALPGRFVENFAGQWLQLRQMQNVSPDATQISPASTIPCAPP